MSLLAVAVELIVNTKLLVPESCSNWLTSLIETVSPSSFSIVPIPTALASVTRPASAILSNRTSDSVAVNVSLISRIVSPVTSTVSVVDVEPATIVAV